MENKRAKGNARQWQPQQNNRDATEDRSHGVRAEVLRLAQQHTEAQYFSAHVPNAEDLQHITSWWNGLNCSTATYAQVCSQLTLYFLVCYFNFALYRQTHIPSYAVAVFLENVAWSEKI
jgi:hypothetical protein